MITQIPRIKRFVDDDGYLTDLSFNWHLNVTNLDMLVGTGSPDGVIQAKQKRLYLQTDGAPRNILWVKVVDSIGGDRSLGWQLV